MINVPPTPPHPASGRLPDGAAVPVLGLAHVPGHAHVQTILPEADSTGGQVAGGVRRGRGAHCGPLSVSCHNTQRVQSEVHPVMALKMKHLHLLTEELYCTGEKKNTPHPSVIFYHEP